MTRSERFAVGCMKIIAGLSSEENFRNYQSENMGVY